MSDGLGVVEHELHPRDDDGDQVVVQRSLQVASGAEREEGGREGGGHESRREGERVRGGREVHRFTDSQYLG
jgi:hypothetical protein